MNRKHVGPESNADYVETDPTGRYGRFGEVLGKGATKTVYKAIDEVLGIEVAWSQVNLKQVLRFSVDLERLYSEVHLLSTLDHKSIVRFYTSWIDVRHHTFNFITELFTSGTLREYRRKYMRIDIRAIKNWARQILEGLVYLHSHDPPVIHRDLKCDNILVNGHLGQVKIGDLGLARILQDSRSAHSVIGTPEFMAPELYEEDYNELVDVYSFGMCVLEMITSELPYRECINPAQIYKKVTSGKLPGAFYRVEDIEAQRFIGKCLVSASKRVSAKELLLDPFLESDEYWMVCRRNPGNPKPFLNENEMEMLKLEDDNDDDDRPRTEMTITGKLNSEDDTIFLKVQIADTDGRARNVYFPFDIVNDTPMEVAVEMVKELEITDWEPFEIAKMISGEISSLVPGSKKWDLPSQQEAYQLGAFGDDPSSRSSSQASLSALDVQGFRDWLQDGLPDETHSQSSSHSGSYSNLSYFSGDELNFEHTSCPVITVTHKLTRFCPEESSHLCYNLAASDDNYKHGNASGDSRNRKLCSDSRRLTRNRSLVDVQSQLLNRSLAEEVRKRRLFKTVGSVETVGFKSPYEACRQASPRSWKPRNPRH